MTSVAVKTADQQASSMILKHRERLLTQRTAAIKALRGLAAEFGVIAAKGAVQCPALLAKLANEDAVPIVASHR